MLQKQSIDVMLLSETWHDADSVSIRRLRAEGYQVIERARPRVRADTLSTNHGGVAVVAVRGIRLTLLDLGAHPTTFEHLCVRVTAKSSSCVMLLLYQPGSVAATTEFFSDMPDVLDRLATFTDPFIVTGDVNVRLDRTDDPSARHFNELVADVGMSCHVTSATHDHGGLLDVVVTRDDLPAPYVNVVDVGLSDHRLLTWSTQLSKPPPICTTTTRCPWRKLDITQFRDALAAVNTVSS